MRRKTDRQVPPTASPFQTIRLVVHPVGSFRVERLFLVTVSPPEKDRLVLPTITSFKGDALTSPQIQKAGSLKATNTIRGLEGTRFRSSMIQI